MSVDDHGLESIRKAAHEVTPGDRSEYKLRVFGAQSVSGLTEAIKVTTLTVGTTATALPATALSNRNSMSIFNKDASTTLYVGPSNVTADDNATTGGWEIDGNSYWSVDIADDIVLYGRVASGSITVKIMELA